jgi:3-methyl-2-oxobutanoate hydroxymethyltransferase
VDGAAQSATRLMKEGGADAVHLEGTSQEAELVAAIVAAGIPVLGHVGVTKQKIVRSGRIKLPAQDAASARETIVDAVEMADAGAFALVLECLPVRIAEIITQSLAIPTIGIGSGPYCDGQALVTQDMLGLYKELTPRFLKVYADISQSIIGALTEFRQEVEGGVFPATEHCYQIDESELKKLLAQLRA